MAYQNVGTPRFWVDWNSYNKAMGVITGSETFRATNDGNDNYSSTYNLNPTNQRHLSPASVDSTSWGHLSLYDNGWILDPEEINWIGLLGHNLGNSGTGFGATLGGDFDGVADDMEFPYFTNYNPIVNGGTPDTTSSKLYPELDGFTIAEIGGFSSAIGSAAVRKLHLEFANDAPTTSMVQRFGAYCLGKYYDMPHSPDLSLKLSYEMDGVKNIQTKGGATLSNASYTKPADWGSGGAWQLGDNQNYRSGRRVWDLSFSYLSDTDVMPENAGTALIDGIDSNVLNGTDFFSQVWNKTMGHLPFIFQPNKDNANPDGFAIARFDMNSLQLTQVGINLYNCSLKIRESW